MLTRKTLLPLVAVATLALTSIGCGSSDTPANCSTDSVNTDEEGPRMKPGGECISCHDQGEGPRYALAGTVMAAANDDVNCDGVESATVVITGADGQSVTLKSNAAGNFFSKSSVAMPYTAKVVRNGKENKMSAAQTEGDCNACHGATGKNGAPGRILAP